MRVGAFDLVLSRLEVSGWIALLLLFCASPPLVGPDVTLIILLIRATLEKSHKKSKKLTGGEFELLIFKWFWPLLQFVDLYRSEELKLGSSSIEWFGESSLSMCYTFSCSFNSQKFEALYGH